MVPLQQVVPGAIVRLIAAQPHSAGKVEAAWRLAVGAALARWTTARREAGGILWVDATDAHVVRELETHRGLIEQRLHAMLGDHGRAFRVTGVAAAHE